MENENGLTSIVVKNAYLIELAKSVEIQLGCDCNKTRLNFV